MRKRRFTVSSPEPSCSKSLSSHCCLLSLSDVDVMRRESSSCLPLSRDRELYRSDNRLLTFDLTDPAIQGVSQYLIKFEAEIE